ncbi:hypothetical protein L484_015220 [Morus notabilis]|uniref:Uncharacterized protein n=1 Tax=Morus notabilis TaxID=981085 RepID=W9SS67_9ROSA|nr:hypothetical protein L484_015220 [Morus notabilis]
MFARSVTLLAPTISPPCSFASNEARHLLCAIGVRDLRWLRGTRSPTRFNISSGLEIERDAEEPFLIYNLDSVWRREIGEEREERNFESSTRAAVAFTLSHVRNLP